MRERTIRGAWRAARGRRRHAAVLVPLVAAALVLATTGLATVHWPLSAAREPAGTSGDALVVSADLQDALRPADAADTRDLDTFVRRLTAGTPRPPDVLLLTEVLGPGARHLARALGEATGDRYTALVAPGSSVFASDASVRESAIVVNTTTMDTVEPGRFVRVQSEDQAYAVLARHGTRLRLPVVAAHAAGDPLPAVRALHAVVDGSGGGAGKGDDSDGIDTVPVLGGDYRSGRCVDPAPLQPVDCAAGAFWTTLTETYGYEDAFFSRSAAATVRQSGYVFAHGTVKDAHVDTAYAADLPDRAACKADFDAGRSAEASARCRADYYADAPFGWAVLTAGQPITRAAVPGRVTLDHCELGVRKGATLARVVNNTDQDLTDQVTATATAPLTVEPATGTLTVPAGQAATLPVRISAPYEGADGTGGTTNTAEDPTTGQVTVTVGGVRTDVTVSLPADCTEAPAIATSYHPGRPPEDAVDGDIDTFWHSEYSPPHPLPQSITVNLEAPKQIHALTYQPRFDGNLNGTITAYNVYVSTDGQDFAKVADGTWPADARLKTADFDPVTARYVRLEATSASGGSFCSAAEIAVE